MKRITHTVILSVSLMLGLADALTRTADAQSVAIQQAVTEFNAANFAKAKPMFAALVKDERNKNLANYYLGRIALTTASYTEARAYFDASISVEPNNADEFYWLGATCGAHLQLPSGSQNMDLFLCYIQNLDAALSRDPAHLLALLNLHQFNVTGPAMAGASPEKAAQLLKQIEAISKVNADIARLFELNYKKATDKSVPLALAMIAAYPDSEKALFEAGRVLSLNKRYVEALGAFEKVTARTRTSDNWLSLQGAYFEIGQISWRSKADLDRGIAALNKALDQQVFPINGYSNWSYWRLAQLHQMKGDIAQQKKYVALLEETGVEKAAALVKEME